MDETGCFPTDGGGSQGEPSATLPQPRGRLGRVQSSRFRGIVLRLDWSHLLVAVVVALLVSETMDNKARVGEAPAIEKRETNQHTSTYSGISPSGANAKGVGNQPSSTPRGIGDGRQGTMDQEEEGQLLSPPAESIQQSPQPPAAPVLNGIGEVEQHGREEKKASPSRAVKEQGMIQPGVAKQTEGEQQLASPPEDIEEPPQQPIVPVLDNTRETEQHGQEEMNGTAAGAAKGNGMSQPGVVEQAKEGRQAPSTAEDVQQSPQQPPIPALNDTDEIEQDAREEKKESPTGSVKENDTIQPGTVDQMAEGQQLTSPLEDVQQSTEQPAFPLLKDNDEIQHHAQEGEKESPAGAVKENDTIHPKAEPTQKVGIFSEEWADQFGREQPGCSGPVTDVYEWRNAGYGSNLNFLMLLWTTAILEGRMDIAVVGNTDLWFPETTCGVTSNGVRTRPGLSCIFSAAPHVCVFDTEQDWINYNQHFNVPAADLKRADDRRGTNAVRFIRHHLDYISDSVEKLGFKPIDTQAMLLDHLQSHLQPWFKADVQRILDEPGTAAVRNGTYLSIHIRRTDKKHEARPRKTEEYFQKAVQYLRKSVDGLTAADITGLWLSTDEDAVYNEVKRLAPRFFPNIKPDGVIYVTGRVAVRSMLSRHPADAQRDRNSYESLVVLRAELEMLANANVFCGTFSSNLSRIVALMRRTLKLPDESGLSADTPNWYIGRHRRRRHRRN
ncbi:unnamed protein product [Ectocarpus fasciculatus]